VSNTVEALRLKNDLESFFTNSDPVGPDASPITALHRGHDGYITFHSALNSDGTPSSKVRQTVAIRADALEGMFPQFANALAEDAYFSINAFAVPKEEQGKALTHSNAVYRSTMTRYLCATHVDIDCYRLGITVGQAIGQVIDAQIKKEIPSPSVYAHSGRGLWLFWFLRDDENALRPPRSFPRNVIQWAAIERKVVSMFGASGADSNAARTTTITRVPGSENSKSGEPVKWLIAGEGSNAYTYTLKELAEWFGVTQADTNYAIASRRIPNNARGHIALHKQRLEQFELLRQIRGGFKEGHRNYAALIYSTILRKNKVHEDDLIKAVEVLARECDPVYPVDEAVRTAVSTISRTRAFKFSNDKIGDSLDITPDEHYRLQEHFRERAWPAASRFGLPAPKPIVDEQKASAEEAKQALIRARHRKILDLMTKAPGTTLRQLSASLRQEGFSGCSLRSVKLDLDRLGLKTRAVVERETAARLRQLQDSIAWPLRGAASRA